MFRILSSKNGITVFPNRLETPLPIAFSVLYTVVCITLYTRYFRNASRLQFSVLWVNTNILFSIFLWRLGVHRSFTTPELTENTNIANSSSNNSSKSRPCCRSATRQSCGGTRCAWTPSSIGCGTRSRWPCACVCPEKPPHPPVPGAATGRKNSNRPTADKEAANTTYSCCRDTCTWVYYNIIISSIAGAFCAVFTAIRYLIYDSYFAD